MSQNVVSATSSSENWSHSATPKVARTTKRVALATKTVARTTKTGDHVTVRNETVRNGTKHTKDCAVRGADVPWNGGDAGTLWAIYSPFPQEAGIAGRRFVTFAARLPNLPLLLAISEAAIEGHHAAGALIEPYLRSRIARINETLRDAQKAELRAEDRVVPPARHGLRSLADILGAA